MSCFGTKGPCERTNIATRVRTFRARWRLLGMVLLAFGTIGVLDARSAAADGTAFVLRAHAQMIAHGHEASCTETDAERRVACPAMHGAHSCLAEPTSIVPPPPRMTDEDCRPRLPWHSLSPAPDPPPPRV